MGLWSVSCFARGLDLGFDDKKIQWISQYVSMPQQSLKVGWPLPTWMFPKIMVPPNHPLKNRGFHYFHHPFWRFSPLFWETSTWRIIPGLGYVVNNHGDRFRPLGMTITQRLFKIGTKVWEVDLDGELWSGSQVCRWFPGDGCKKRGETPKKTVRKNQRRRKDAK